MRTVIIDIKGNDFTIYDNEKQYVDVTIVGDNADFVSFLHFDETPCRGNCHKDDAMPHALYLMGILN